MILNRFIFLKIALIFPARKQDNSPVSASLIFRRCLLVKLRMSAFIIIYRGTDEGNACRAFLQKIGYGSCFRSHREDADFLSNNWIVWLEPQTLNLNSQHDYLRLYDKDGNLVSEYNY